MSPKNSAPENIEEETEDAEDLAEEEEEELDEESEEEEAEESEEEEEESDENETAEELEEENSSAEEGQEEEPKKQPEKLPIKEPQAPTKIQNNEIAAEKNESDDALLIAVVNFLVPIILLYGLFILIEIFSEGFFSAMHAALISLAGLLLFATKSSYRKLLSHINFRLIHVVFFLCFAACTIAVLLLISDFLMK